MLVKDSTTTKSVDDASLRALLLDSSLIAQTDKKECNLKLTNRNELIQIYI